MTLAETPATDPKALTDRCVEASAVDFTGDKRKQHMKLIFKTTELADSKLNTRFNGYRCTNEFVTRFVRKGSQKIDATDYVETKDEWKLQVTVVAILNRNVDTNLQKKARKFVVKKLKDTASKNNLADFIKGVMASVYQKDIRKQGSKIYPIRFAEISKIEVIKPGAG